MFQSLHSSITVEIWKRSGRQIHTCWPIVDFPAPVNPDLKPTAGGLLALLLFCLFARASVLARPAGRSPWHPSSWPLVPAPSLRSQAALVGLPIWCHRRLGLRAPGPFSLPCPLCSVAFWLSRACSRWSPCAPVHALLCFVALSPGHHLRQLAAQVAWPRGSATGVAVKSCPPAPPGRPPSHTHTCLSRHCHSQRPRRARQLAPVARPLIRPRLTPLRLVDAIVTSAVDGCARRRNAPRGAKSDVHASADTLLSV